MTKKNDKNYEKNPLLEDNARNRERSGILISCRLLVLDCGKILANLWLAL